VLRDFYSFARRNHSRAILRHRELRIAYFNSNLVLELLQVELGLSEFQFGTYLVSLRGAISQRDVQVKSYRVVR